MCDGAAQRRIKRFVRTASEEVAGHKLCAAAQVRLVGLLAPDLAGSGNDLAAPRAVLLFCSWKDQSCYLRGVSQNASGRLGVVPLHA